EVDPWIELPMGDARMGGDVAAPPRRISDPEVVDLAWEFVEPDHLGRGVGSHELHPDHRRFRFLCRLRGSGAQASGCEPALKQRWGSGEHAAVQNKHRLRRCEKQGVSKVSRQKLHRGITMTVVRLKLERKSSVRLERWDRTCLTHSSPSAFDRVVGG